MYILPDVGIFLHFIEKTSMQKNYVRRWTDDLSVIEVKQTLIPNLFICIKIFG